jgi:hypothetical protein
MRRFIITVAFLHAFVAGCGAFERPDPVHCHKNYHFDPRSPLESRISLPPSFVLDYLKKLDSRPDYEGYLPSLPEQLALQQAFNNLPSLNRSVCEKRLLGIYFINNFTGNGLSEWVTDGKGNIYAVMVLNSSVLRMTISELLTAKEKTCFINDDPAIDIRINTGSRFSGLSYILLHESTHVVDYVQAITPYVDNSSRDHFKKRPSSTIFTQAIWAAYDKPSMALYFTGNVFFYGIKAPQLHISHAADVYKELGTSPFPSLYASQSWAEDLAELLTFYHLTAVMQQPYIIEVLKNSRIIFSIRPMDGLLIQKRVPYLKLFYRPGTL